MLTVGFLTELALSPIIGNEHDRHNLRRELDRLMSM